MTYREPGSRGGLSRRDFLKLAALGAAALAGRDIIDRIDLSGKTEKLLTDLERDYGLHGVNGVGSLDWRAESLSPIDYYRGLRRIAREVAKYPPDFFTQNGVKDIHLVNFGMGKALPERRAVVVPKADPLTLLLTTTGDIFNHETWHVAEELGRFPRKRNVDSIWAHYHDNICDPYKRYPEGEKNPLEPCSSSYYTFPYEANWRPSEDRAFWAMRMMNPIDHANLRRSLDPLDSNLRKVRRQKYADMKSTFRRLSNELMGDQYWLDLIAGKVKSGYFDQE